MNSLHGGNYPTSKAGSEDFGPSNGGSTTTGLSHQVGFMGEDPASLGLDSVGENQRPMRTPATPADRGHRFG